MDNKIIALVIIVAIIAFAPEILIAILGMAWQLFGLLFVVVIGAIIAVIGGGFLVAAFFVMWAVECYYDYKRRKRRE